MMLAPKKSQILHVNYKINAYGKMMYVIEISVIRTLINQRVKLNNHVFGMIKHAIMILVNRYHNKMNA